MKRRYITVDVFTDRAFGGNPLAVVLDVDGLSTAQMQSIASEFNYSETTFVLRRVEAAHRAGRRHEKGKPAADACCSRTARSFPRMSAGLACT